VNTIFKLGRYSLYFFALGFLGFGLLFLVSPTTLTTLADISLPTPIALMEIRGVYGGFFIGAGLFLLICAWRESWLRPGMMAQATILGGLVIGRVLGLLIDGPANPFIYLLLLSEIVGLVISIAVLRKFMVPTTQDL
jgi:hypothetical protein